MRSRFFPAAFLAAMLVCSAQADSLPNDTPLVVDGPVKVDAGDFEAAMKRVPEDRRAEFRASYDRVAAMVDNVFLARSFAEKAKEAGLDKDPILQRQLAEARDAVLADRYLKYIESNAPKVDLEQRAREIYEADRPKYVRPEQVDVQLIYIDLNGRTVEMAKERAQKVYEEATSGKEDFLALAARYSDDKNKSRNGGDIGWNSPKSFLAPVQEWLAKPHKKGDISPPISSEVGFQILRFVEYKAPEQIPFDELKESLIRSERARLTKKRGDDAIQAVRGSKTVVIHVDNVEKLVMPVNDTLSKPAAAATKPTPGAPAKQ